MIIKNYVTRLNRIIFIVNIYVYIFTRSLDLQINVQDFNSYNKYSLLVVIKFKTGNKNGGFISRERENGFFYFELWIHGKSCAK